MSDRVMPTMSRQPWAIACSAVARSVTRAAWNVGRPEASRTRRASSRYGASGKAIPGYVSAIPAAVPAYRPFTFKKCGQSGIDVADLFPHLGRHVDEIAFLRSVYGRSNDHVQGTYEMQTGQINLGFPSVGSWVTYGLGSVASSLPAYVVMTDARGGPMGGPNDWSAGFLPAV